MIVVCFGPGPVFKGGIANYNTSLAKAFDKRTDCEVHIVSWTQQYPAIIPRDFIDKASRVDQLAGTGISVHYLTNYNNPFTWTQTVEKIRSLKPDLVIFQWAIAIQGLPISFIAKRLEKSGIKTVFDLHFVIQKENSSIDRIFTKWALSRSKRFVTHARKTFDELRQLFPDKNFTFIDRGDSIDDAILSNETESLVINLYHPVYDMFTRRSDFDVDAFKAEHRLRKHVFLFFGFIRKYKGLHNVIPAFRILADRRDDVSLIICGESFWKTLDKSRMSTKVKSALFGLAKKIFLRKSDDESDYNPLALVDELNLKDRVVMFNSFVPNEEVHRYFQVSDAVLLFYEYATPSGVESIGYNFNMPILATAVGHFPETVVDGYNGYLVQPDNIEDMAATMEKFLEHPIDRENVAATSKDMSWDNYAARIARLG
ncbi:MAG TPA: glycosyltransferase [Saprospiraceae bacterium]|nr:glycosyltransferase [Saprospiraceae bacterium]